VAFRKRLRENIYHSCFIVDVVDYLYQPDHEHHFHGYVHDLLQASGILLYQVRQFTNESNQVTNLTV
jgi:hypothetical protein